MIKERSFQDSGLEEFIAPVYLREISQSAFCCCENLKRVVLNEGLEVLGTSDYIRNRNWRSGVFQESAVEEVTLPSTLKTIEYGAFLGCKNLNRMYISGGRETVGNCRGGQCEPGLAEIPKAVVEIRHNAF